MITNEAIADEFSRLIREYHEGDEATRPEAWNLLADFAVENAAILTAALAAMPGPAVKVRELVFVEEVPNWFVARALGSTYEARLTDRGNVRVRNPIDRKWEYFHGKIQDALRALNSDYKARILSALTPAPDLQAENERLRAALEFVTLWAWREDPPNANRKLTDEERLSAIKYHPSIRPSRAALERT